MLTYHPSKEELYHRVRSFHSHNTPAPPYLSNRVEEIRTPLLKKEGTMEDVQRHQACGIVVTSVALPNTFWKIPRWSETICSSSATFVSAPSATTDFQVYISTVWNTEQTRYFKGNERQRTVPVASHSNRVNSFERSCSLSPLDPKVIHVLLIGVVVPSTVAEEGPFHRNTPHHRLLMAD